MAVPTAKRRRYTLGQYNAVRKELHELRVARPELTWDEIEEIVGTSQGVPACTVHRMRLRYRYDDNWVRDRVGHIATLDEFDAVLETVYFLEEKGILDELHGKPVFPSR